MKATITIEQFDNGISIVNIPDDANMDDRRVVSMSHTKLNDIGAVIWENIETLMENDIKSKVKMEITYTAID